VETLQEQENRGWKHFRNRKIEGENTSTTGKQRVETPRRRGTT